MQGQQLFMVPTLQDLAILHDQDLVRRDNRRQTVSNDQGGLVLGHPFELGLDGSLIGTVQGRGGLIEN